jgi:hypothetical protein
MPDQTLKTGFGPCCFCGLPIAESKIDPCSVAVTTREEKWQVWYAHGECFRDRLNLDNPEMDLSPAFF